MPRETDADELARLEALLRTLRPTADEVHTDVLFYRAGQASARRRAWIWPSTSALLAAGLGLSLWLRAAPPHAETIYVERLREPAAPLRIELPRDAVAIEPRESVETRLASSDAALLRARDIILRFGVDAVPRQSFGSSSTDDVPVKTTSVRDGHRFLGG